MEATNQNNLTQFYVIKDDMPPLSTIFTAAVPPNLLAKLDKRSLERQSKGDTEEKLVKAENYRIKKIHELMQKAHVKESKHLYAKDHVEKGPIYQQEQKNKVNALE